MKKTAIFIYEQFCNFEIAPLLEVLKIKNKPFTVFSKDLSPVTSEEGLIVLPQKSIEDFDVDEYDSLVLPGAMDIRGVVDDEDSINFIKKFSNLKIAAISIAPILLLKSSMLYSKRFMAGVNKEELMEEGFSKEDLHLMRDWEENAKEPLKDGYIIDGNIITSVSYEFLRWTLGFASMLELEVSPEMFGIREQL
ncbi:DJ-1/PfpI family protein [Filifactor villosus]|uniref:DJ-1/PfpI family protein n=1 Tax=Filifactor villosus TaxID=29374 RepID=A0ABV9QNF5_9FIRM